jgi:small conductance mechanosensitive channel
MQLGMEGLLDNITTNNFDVGLLWTTYGPMITSGGLKVIGALLVLVVGLKVANGLSQFVQRTAEQNERIDATLGAFFASLVRYLVIVVVIITVLQVFGVQATSLVAVLGAATLAVGLALQGTLGSLAAGVMLILFRPYKLGDLIFVTDKTGYVRDINLFTTVLATVDNIQITIPNGMIWGGTITNLSGLTRRRIEQTFRISYQDQADAAVKLIEEIIKNDPRTLQNPQLPSVRICELGEAAIVLKAQFWVDMDDPEAFDFVRSDVLANVHQELNRAGFHLPYPTAIEIEATEAKPGRQL